MPILLYQLYAYVLPAFSEAEKRIVLPMLIAAPFLFVSGVPFAYFVVMPAAVKFLLGFNDSQFNVQVRARDYYSFFSMTMLAGGVIFEMPLAILAVTRLGIVKVEQLSSNRRYAYLVIAIVAAALPGVDPVSMLLEMVPLLVLYELSILLARAFGTPKVAGAMASLQLRREKTDGRRSATDGVRHSGSAETRRQSRLRDPRPADGRESLPRRRPGQHRHAARQRKQPRAQISKNRRNESNAAAKGPDDAELLLALTRAGSTPATGSGEVDPTTGERNRPPNRASSTKRRATPGSTT